MSNSSAFPDDHFIFSDWFSAFLLVCGLLFLGLSGFFHTVAPFTDSYTVSVHGDPVPANELSAENTLFEENQSAYQKRVIQESLGSEYTIIPSEEAEKDLQELDNMSYVVSGNVGYEISVSKSGGQPIYPSTLLSLIIGLVLIFASAPFLIASLLLKIKRYIHDD